MISENNEILTPEEVGEILKIGKNATYALLKDNKISSFKIGRNYKIPRTSIDSYIKNEIYK